MKRLCLFAIPVAIAAASIAGCFPALEKDPDFPKYFTKKVPGNTVQARLEGDRLYGADVEVKKDAGTYRGHSGAGVVDLRATTSAEGTKIDGDSGNGRTELYVTEIEGGVSAKGMIGGTVSHFDLTPSSFTGTVGSCTYDLRFSEQSRPYYEGNSRCTGGGGGTRVALPEKFAELPLDEKAVFVAVFLGQ